MLDATYDQFQERVVVPLRWYFGQLGQQFLIHDCMTRAGALTYTTLFAVVPMMTVAYAMFSVLPEFEGVGERIQEYIFQNFVPDSSAVVQERLLEFSARARQLTAAGFLVLFITAFMMLVSVEKTFNTIWSVAEPRRGLLRMEKESVSPGVRGMRKRAYRDGARRDSQQTPKAPALSELCMFTQGVGLRLDTYNSYRARRLKGNIFTAR